MPTHVLGDCSTGATWIPPSAISFAPPTDIDDLDRGGTGDPPKFSMDFGVQTPTRDFTSEMTTWVGLDSKPATPERRALSVWMAVTPV